MFKNLNAKSINDNILTKIGSKICTGGFNCPKSSAIVQFLSLNISDSCLIGRTIEGLMR